MNMKIIIRQGSSTRALTKQAPTADGLGTQPVPDGLEDFKFEVAVDDAALRGFVARAARNVRGVAVCGPFRATVTDRRRR